MNFIQRAWNDVSGYLNTPQGRQLQTGGVPNIDVAGIESGALPTGVEGAKGMPSLPVLVSRKYAGQGPPQDVGGTQVLSPAVAGGYPGSVMQPRWVAAPTPTTQVSGVPNIDVTASTAGALPTGVEGSKGMPPITRMIAQGAGQGPPQDVTATQERSPAVAGGYPGAVMQPRWPATVAAPAAVAQRPTVQTVAPGQTPTIGGQPVARPTYGPLAGEVTGGTTGTTATQPAQYGPLAGAVTGGGTPTHPATSQPLGTNQGFEASEYPNNPIAVEHKVQNADGSSTHIKHTTAQGAAQKQQQQAAGTGQQPAGGGQQGVRGQQGGGQGMNLQGYSGGGGQTVGQWMQNAQQGQGQPGLAGPSGPQGQAGTTSVQVPAHPGLLQRIGQTIQHFFTGTLGQGGQPQGQTVNLGRLPDQTQGSALSGIRNALAQGHTHIARHGATVPGSKPAPGGGALGLPSQGEPGTNWAYEEAPGTHRWQPTPLGSADITNPLAAAPNVAYDPYHPYGGAPSAEGSDIVNPLRATRAY